MTRIKNYDISADIIRIIAIFFVVFSHTTDRFVLYTTLKGSVSWKIVYYLNTLSHVAVPLFIILSGYLLLKKEKTNNVKLFYKRRLLKILSPFLIWLCIYFGYSVDWNLARLTPQYIFINLWHADIWHLYFIIIIIELYIIAPFLVKFAETKNKKKQTILFCVLIAIGIFFSLLDIFHIDVRRIVLTMFIPYIGIFYAGAYLRLVRLKKLMVFITLAAYFILPIVTNLIANGDIGSFIVFNYSPTLLPMTICLFLSLKNVNQFFGQKLKSKSFEKIIAFIASTTFGIFFVHLIVLDKVFSYFHLLPWQISSPIVFNACLPAFITFIISFIIVTIIKRFPYGKYLVG